MKVNINILIWLAGFSILFSACNKKDELDSKSVFIDSTIPKNPLDTYLYTNYLKPYNVEVQYKYVDRESDLSYRLVPAPYESSIRLVKLMLYAVLEPYNEVTGSRQFLKDNFPKQITFTGSVPVQTNGNTILGTAESGTKINLYNLLVLDAFSSQSSEFLNHYYFHTIHHEFQHILNQNKPYPSNFREISGLKYVEDEWNKAYDSQTAIAAGFITPYASKSDTEDFAEIYSAYVTNTSEYFEAIISYVGNDSEGKAIILSKLAIIKSYMKSIWGIDMDQLREKISKKYEDLDTFDQLTLN